VPSPISQPPSSMTKVGCLSVAMDCLSLDRSVFGLESSEGLCPRTSKQATIRPTGVLVDPAREPLIAALLAGLPLLSSKPKATDTIYLDFNGHQTTDDSAWGAFEAYPYSLDNNYASFDQTEQLAIESIWRRVTEDFAPWHVDVTTVSYILLTLRRRQFYSGCHVFHSPPAWAV